VLEGDEPSVTIAAAYAKNRRQDTLPLKPQTAAALAAHLAGKMPAAQAFNVPRRTEVARMFREDREATRRAWINDAPTPAEQAEREKNTFLAEKDESGRYADFHALRHTFITGLVTGGVNPKVAQTLARHSVITLTMDRYTHLYAGNLASALDVLPDLTASPKQAQVATGTDDDKPRDPPRNGPARLSPSLSPKSGGVRFCAVPRGIGSMAAGRLSQGEKITESGRKTQDLTQNQESPTLERTIWRGGGAAERAGFENRLARKGHGGSNPPLSVITARHDANVFAEPLL